MRNYFAKARASLAKKRGRKVTQREIANLLGYTDKLVGMWETEVSAPPIARADDIAKAYEVARSIILSETAELAARIAAKRDRETVSSK